MKLLSVRNKNLKKIVIILLLFFITVGIFSYTVYIRKPWFGTLHYLGHQINSGLPLLYSNNWYNEGAFDLDFLMLRNPESIEFPDIKSRNIYSSYPSGSILPIYVISKLIGQAPDINMLMSYNLFNHFIIAFLLSLIIFFFLRKLNFNYINSFLLSIIPIIMELLLPGPLYWHQMVFFVDQAVILLFVIFIFLEVLRGNVKSKKALVAISILQGLLLFYGTLTDYLFIFIALAVYIKRIFCSELGKRISTFIRLSIVYWLPVIFSLSLFASQLYYFKMHRNLFYTFLFRTSNENIAGFFKQFWLGHMVLNFGKAGTILIWMTLILFTISFFYLVIKYLIKRKVDIRVKETLSLIFIILSPCFFQVYSLKNHSLIHSFSALKFSIPLSTLPFIVIPVLLSLLFQIDLKGLYLRFRGFKIPRNSKRICLHTLVVILCIFLLAGIYLWKEHPGYKELFPEVDRSFEKIGSFVSANTDYNDIVFSYDYEITYIPMLYYSMKRVYLISSVFDIYDSISTNFFKQRSNPSIYNMINSFSGNIIINKDFEINLLLNKENISKERYDLVKLISKAYEAVEEDNLILYKIKKQDFLNFFSRKTIFDFNSFDKNKIQSSGCNIDDDKIILGDNTDELKMFQFPVNIESDTYYIVSFDIKKNEILNNHIYFNFYGDNYDEYNELAPDRIIDDYIEIKYMFNSGKVPSGNIYFKISTYSSGEIEFKNLAIFKVEINDALVDV